MPSVGASPHGPAAAWPSLLKLSSTALPSNVRRLRRALAGWLAGDDLGHDTVDDLLLATSEALENCCDHAFVDAATAGTMTLCARESPDRLVITVRDDGQWHTPATGPTHRGRGLAMMRMLVDHVDLTSDTAGTRIVLTQERGTAGGRVRSI